MAGIGDFASIISGAVGDMPDKLKSASDGFKGLFVGFNDLVRRT